LIIWGLFTYFTSPQRRAPAVNELAAEQGNQPLNKRLSEVEGARLEALRLREAGERFRSSQELKEGNSPEFYPEQIRPENVPALSDLKAAFRPVPGQPGAVMVPVDVAMKLALQKNLLKSQEKAVDPATVPSSLRTREGNGGLGPAGEGAKP
jgi:hypothetical protein